VTPIDADAAFSPSTTSLNRAIKGAKAKQPYAVGMKSGASFALAGIWDEDRVRTFCVITTTANGAMSEIRERMPVIFAPKNYDRWLSTSELDPRDLLGPFPSELMIMCPI
jgi:putative SOS response-associated peptidase YedK